MEDKDRKALTDLMADAEKLAVETIEAKYPKHIATTFEVKLPIGIKAPDDTLFEGCLINRVTVGRQNRLQRRQGNLDMLASGVSKTDAALNKMMSVIRSISAVDEAGSVMHTFEWRDVPANVRTALLNEMDIIDEDELLEGITALEYGYGDIKSFYASQAFAELKKRQEESFQTPEIGI